MQGDKTVAFCNRNCNIISPFVRAPANRNETIMLKPGLEQLALSAKAAGFRLKGSVIRSLININIPNMTMIA